MLLLTPFHLYKKYHHFPISVALNVILIMFLSTNALILSDEFIGYGRANEQTFESLFMPQSDGYGALYSVPDTLDLIKQTVVNVRM